MLSLVSLLAAAALVSLQSVRALSLDRPKLHLDNNLQPNVVPPKRGFVPPYVRVTALPEAVYVSPGQRLELKCEAYGSPNPTISWLKNGEPFDYEDETNDIMSPPAMSIAHMTARLPLPAPAPGDVYTCVATAGANQQTTSTTVLYTAPVEDSELMTLENLLLPAAPVITAAYNEVLQLVGSAVQLPCRVHSDSKPRVYWQDYEDKLVVSNNRIRVLPSGDLLISALRWSDMGGFTCTASNAVGKDSVTTFVYPTVA